MRVHPGGCCQEVCRVSAYQRANWRASERQRPHAHARGNREASSVANVRSTECMDGALCTTLSVVPRAKSEEPDLLVLFIESLGTIVARSIASPRKKSSEALIETLTENMSGTVVDTAGLLIKDLRMRGSHPRCSRQSSCSS